MDVRLLALLVCPLCKGPLDFDKPAGELICRGDRLAFPVRDGIPLMLEDEARTWSPDEAEAARVSPLPMPASAP